MLTYERIDPATGRTFLIALNLAATVAHITVDACDGSEAVICTNSQREGKRVSGELNLAANEGVVICLKNDG